MTKLRAFCASSVAWGLPLVAVLVSCWPLFLHGFPQGHDCSHELARVAEFAAAAKSGQLPPAWAPNLYGGYGSPIFLFYAPLYCAVASLLSVLTGSVPTASGLALVLMSAVAAVCTYLLVKELCGGLAAGARVGVYLYVLHPYLLGDKLIRNANAEFTALCIMPLALYGVVLLRRRPRAAALVLAAALALTTLAHNLTALVTAAMVLLVAACLYLPRPRIGVWRGFAVGVALGLGLSLFFWLPAMTLTNLVRTDELLTGKFDFRNQFSTWRQLIYESDFFAMGWLTLCALPASLAVMTLRRGTKGTQRRLGLVMLAGTLALAFLLTPMSKPVWEHVPLMPYFQFPWRLVGPLALITAVASGVAFAALMRDRSRRRQWLIEVVLFLLCVTTAYPVLRNTRSIETDRRAELAREIEPDVLRTRIRSATVRNEYLPRDAELTGMVPSKARYWPIIHASKPLRVIRAVDEGTRLTVKLEAAAPTTVEVARWYFPQWSGTINGAGADLRAGPHGGIEAQVPAGASSLVLNYKAPPIRRAASYLSLTFVIVWGALAVLNLRERGGPAPVPPD